MKKTFLFLSLLAINPTLAQNKCFIAKENNKVIVSEGDCNTRHSPCSTFKIAISLMAYDEELLTDEKQPELPFKKGYADYRDQWKQPHNPTLWMQNSCVWYSQVLTQKLGMKKFKQYIKKLNYGNQDVSGDKALTNSWLSGSIEISPNEQIILLQNLIDNKLPVSPKAQQKTKNILFVEELPNGWRLYGKTGSGYQRENPDLKQGWFVGWIQKGDRSIVFANYIADETKQDTHAGPRAKADAKERLMQLI